MLDQEIKRFDYILLYLLIAVSGSLRFKSLPDLALIVLLGIVFFYAVFLRKERISVPFFGYSAVLVLFLIIGYYYTDHSLSFNSILGLVVKLFVAYFLLIGIGGKFIDVYLRALYFLAIVSLFGFLVDILGFSRVITSFLPSINGGSGGYEGYLYVLSHPTHYNRNQGIFFEPGAYQIYLNVALVMLLFFKNSLSRGKRNIYFVIFCLTLLTTTSTAGIIILSGIVALGLLKSSRLGRPMKSMIILAVVIVSGLGSSYVYEVVGDKLESYAEGGNIAQGGVGGSGERRAFDAKVDMMIFKRDILGVGQERYSLMFASIGRTTASGSSNGITKSLAVYGLPFTLFLLASYYIGIKKLIPDIFIANSLYLFFIIFLMGEAYFVIAPATLAIIASMFVMNTQSRFLVGTTDEK